MTATLVSSEELTIPEREVLAALRRNDHELAPSDLVQMVLTLSPELSDVDVKRAIWNLISRGQIRLSAEQLLGLAQKTEQEAA